MNVIAHEAVRDNGKLAVGCRSRNLRQCEIDNVLAGEERFSLMCAKRQEVSVKAGVIEMFEMVGLVSEHGAAEGKMRAKWGAAHGPAKAGHDVLT